MRNWECASMLTKVFRRFGGSVCLNLLATLLDKKRSTYLTCFFRFTSKVALRKVDPWGRSKTQSLKVCESWHQACQSQVISNIGLVMQWTRQHGTTWLSRHWMWKPTPDLATLQIIQTPAIRLPQITQTITNHLQELKLLLLRETVKELRALKAQTLILILHAWLCKLRRKY